MNAKTTSPLGATGYQLIAASLLDTVVNITRRQRLIHLLDETIGILRPHIPTAEDLGERTISSAEMKAFVFLRDHEPTPTESRLIAEVKSMEVAIKETAMSARWFAEIGLGEIKRTMEFFYEGTVSSRVPRNKTPQQHFIDQLHGNDASLYNLIDNGIDLIQKAKSDPAQTM